MNNLPEIVNNFLVNYELLNYDSPFLVAFSGGFDSMSLLHILKNITGKDIIAIHLNHKWRGEESDKEEENCRRFCNEIGVEFYSEKLSSDIPKTETAAREARYSFFEKCANKYKSEVIFTAQNADDNAETVLYRIIKGTGIDGLAGIAPERKPYYRPLIKASRALIEDYCNENDLSPNIDSSNSDTKYNRNYIRHEIIPKLKKINPKVVKVLNSLSELAQEDSLVLNELMAKIGNSTEKFMSSTDAIKNRVIKNLLSEFDIDYDRKKLLLLTKFIEDNHTLKSGKTVSLSKDLDLYVNNRYFRVIDKSKNSSPNNQIEIKAEGEYSFADGVVTVEKCDCLPEKFPKDSDKMIFANLDRLEFTLRTREAGDFILPLGLKGTQKLKKYFNEKKIPPFEKDRIPLFCRGHEVYWAIGYGISDKIKVRDKVTHVIRYESRRENND